MRGERRYRHWLLIWFFSGTQLKLWELMKHVFSSLKWSKFLKEKKIAIDLFTDTAAILDSIVSDIYYGMLRGQIHTNLPPEHPIITIWNNRIQNGRRIGKKVYYPRNFQHNYRNTFSPNFSEKRWKLTRNEFKICAEVSVSRYEGNYT